MHRFSAALAVFAGIVLTGAGLPAQTPGQRLELDRKGETIVLEPYAPNILRVTLSLKREPALAAPGYGFVAAPAAAGWSASQTAQADVYQSARIVATVDRELPPAPSLRIRRSVDIGKVLQRLDSRRAHHPAHARGQDAAGTHRLDAVRAQPQGRHGRRGPRPPSHRCRVLHRGRDLRLARRRALLRPGPEPGGLSRPSRPCGALLGRLHGSRRRPASACRSW